MMTAWEEAVVVVAVAAVVDVVAVEAELLLVVNILKDSIGLGGTRPPVLTR